MKIYNKVVLPLLLSMVIVGCGSDNVEMTEPVTDQTPPIITLIGDDNLILALGETYQELGSTVTDNTDNGLVASISGQVDSSTPYTYTITYTASDLAGNETVITRTVIIEAASDDEAPAIVLIGDTIINLTVGNAYSEQGISVTDNIDHVDDISVSMIGQVNTNIVGTYTITYQASDIAGNQSMTITRTVIIKDNDINPPTTEGYIFHSANDDSFPMDYWGDTWDTNTVYTDQPTDTTYAKALEISKSEKWGTLVAWGNEAENTIDISSYTHAKFKVKTDTFTQVEVFVQSHTLSASQITYNLSSGVDLGNGWFEVQVTLPAFTDMTWFALNFIGDAGTILLADVYFATLATEPVEGPALAAPLPPAYTDDEVVVLYSDSLSQDSFIGVWNANWWNAPIYAEGNVNGDYFAKYQITAGGIAGGVTGLEFGFEIEPLDASTKTTFNFDLFVEPGISKIIVQLVSTDGGASYTINNPTAGTWSSYELLFSDLLDNDGTAMGVLNGGSLQSIGLQLYGEAGQAVYLDNLYFSGQSVFYDLAVSVTDNNNVALANALVSVGNVTATTNASGVATLNLPEGEHKIIVDANGFGVTQGNQRIAGGEASLALGVIPLNTGPSVSAPLPTESNDVFVLYSDVLTVDKAISYWSDNWWNAPRFSEITIADETIAKLQIIPEGIAGGVTGIQYGIEGGIVDVSMKTGLRFDIYATSGISKAVFQIVSSTGPGIYTMDSVSNEQWVTVELPFTALVDSTGNFNPALLTQLGIGLWGSTSDALYIDNIYFY